MESGYSFRRALWGGGRWFARSVSMLREVRGLDAEREREWGGVVSEAERARWVLCGGVDGGGNCASLR